MTSTPKALKQQRARRREFVAAGLTVYGTPRKNYPWPELDGLPPRERMNERIRICTLRRRRAKKNGGIGFVLEARLTKKAAWAYESKILRIQIDAAAASIAEVFHELPPKARVRCLALSESLATIRRGIA